MKSFTKLSTKSVVIFVITVVLPSIISTSYARNLHESYEGESWHQTFIIKEDSVVPVSSTYGKPKNGLRADLSEISLSYDGYSLEVTFFELTNGKVLAQLNVSEDNGEDFVNQVKEFLKSYWTHVLHRTEELIFENVGQTTSTSISTTTTTTTENSLITKFVLSPTSTTTASTTTTKKSLITEFQLPLTSPPETPQNEHISGSTFVRPASSTIATVLSVYVFLPNF